MASRSGSGRPQSPCHVENEVRAEVEADDWEEQIVVVHDHVQVAEDGPDVLPTQFGNIVGVTADGDSEVSNDGDGDDCDGDDGVDDLFRAAIEAILPICGGCDAGPCRYGITDSGRVYLKCCIKEGFGSCGFFQWVDAKKISESQKRIEEIAKRVG